MALRIAIVATAFLGTLATLYHITTSQTSIMASHTSDQAPSRDVSVELSLAKAPLTVKVTIRNDSPDKTFSFLSWDSPFDPQAVNTGVLSLKDTETGDEIEGPGLKLHRMLPPPRDDLIEISPGSSSTRELGLRSPWVPTDGKKYQIQLRGSWRAAWSKVAADVSDRELESMGSDGAPKPFESGQLEMQLKQ
jgi:hypothetical protein